MQQGKWVETRCAGKERQRKKERKAPIERGKKDEGGQRDRKINRKKLRARGKERDGDKGRGRELY